MTDFIEEDFERVGQTESYWLGVEREWRERKLWEEIKEEMGWLVTAAAHTKRMRIINVKGNAVQRGNHNRRHRKGAK